jgi:hypothetical protein
LPDNFIELSSVILQLQYKFVYHAAASSLTWTPADEPLTSVDPQPETTNGDRVIYGNVDSATECENSESNIYANIPRAECAEDNLSPATGEENLYANFSEAIAN